MTPVPQPHKGLNAAVAAVLRAERAAQDLTVQELADSADIPYATLRRYLKAERHIDVATLAELCEALDIDVEDVVIRAVERLRKAVEPTDIAAARADRDYPAPMIEAARPKHGKPKLEED